MISLLKWNISFQAHFHKVLDDAGFLCLGSTVALKGGSQSPLLLPDVLFFKLCLSLCVCFRLEVVIDRGLANVIQNHIAGSTEELSSIFVQLAAKLSYAILRSYIQSSLRAVT